ncbi:MAG: hypothetical protein GXZ19_08565, partial [Bacteroidales bacterium]|nr:hypothetical protein [Bacteroidales bacterium]
MRKLVSFFFLLITFGTVFAQDLNEVVNRFNEQLLLFPHEKLYVQTDKPTYLSGERVWFRSHMVEASSNMPVFLSRYIYIELSDPFGQLIQRIKIRPDSVGVYSGHLDLDEELPEGIYTIRAYTRYMRNRGNEAFFKKTIQVLDPYSLQLGILPHFEVNGNRVNANFRFVSPASKDTITPEIVTLKLSDETARTISPDKSNYYKWNFTMTKKRSSPNLLLSVVHEGRKYNKYYPIPYDANEFDVTFHPEGGYLVPDQECRVGFKAINSSGLSEEITGTIYNSENVAIVDFSSIRLGMGFFDFTPVANERYYALCKTERSETKRVDLPLADIHSKTLSVLSVDHDRRLISLLRNNEAEVDSLSILIHRNGVVCFYQIWDDPSKPYSFTSAQFPSGTLSILLLNKQHEILSERMLFNLNQNDFANSTVDFSASTYKRRELVRLQLKVVDSDSITFSDNIAVSVTDKSAVPRDTTNNILSSFLLSSELKGFIESPASYFDGYNIIDVDGLDALMLTQGWRRYNVPDLLKGKIALPDQYRPEEFQEVSGKSDLLFGGLKEGEISLYATLDTLFSGETTTADEKGRFMFKVEYPENTEITVQSLSKKGGKRNMINLDMESFPDDTFSTIPVRGLKIDQAEEFDLEAYMKKANDEYNQKYGIRTIMLDEVVVTAQRKESYSESIFYSPIHATGLITLEEIEKRKVSSFRTLLVTNPSLIVKGDGTVTTTQSDMPVAFIIDDVNHENFQIESIDIADIDNMFVLKSNVGLMTYSPGTQGAVVITTKRGFVQKNVKSMNIDRIKPLGYQPPVEFYTPAYETEQQRELSPVDLRTTIYWKPNVQFSERGEAVVEFYSADTPTTYQLVGEGVLSSGKMVRLEKEIIIDSSY